jgi:hypothetical protein
MNPGDWPWYEVVEDGSFDQGDIIPGCPVLHAVEGEDGEAPVGDLLRVTALVVTQTCDLAQAKADSVVLCAVWSVAQAILQDPVLAREARDTATRHHLVLPAADAPDVEESIEVIIEHSKQLKKELNAIMKGERPPFALLEKHDAHPRSARALVTFQQVYSLPRPVLERLAAKPTPRLRLLPPYREYISQAFGRYFTRIGLLQDIPRYPG